MRDRWGDGVWSALLEARERLAAILPGLFVLFTLLILGLVLGWIMRVVLERGARRALGGDPLRRGHRAHAPRHRQGDGAGRVRHHLRRTGVRARAGLWARRARDRRRSAQAPPASRVGSSSGTPHTPVDRYARPGAQRRACGA